MNNEEFQKIVLEKLNKFDNLERAVSSVEQNVISLGQTVSSVEQSVSSLEGKVSSAEQTGLSLEQTVLSIHKIVIKIENEHGEKLSALFDGWKQNTEQLKRIEQEVSRHEEIILRKIK